MARVSLPTTARLPSSLRVDASNPTVLKVLNRLTRPSLLSLVLDWLDPKNQTLCPPILRHPEEDEDEDEDDLYPPAHSLDELQSIYADLQARKGSRREVVDRITEGDWRHGLSLYQLAMADMQYLYDHPGTLKWSAYRVERLRTPRHEDDVDDDSERGWQKIDNETLDIPRFHPSTFLQNLQAEFLPDVKAHYNIDRPPGLPLLLLRIFVLDSPYNTDLAVFSKNRNRNRASLSTSVRTSTGSIVEMSTSRRTGGGKGAGLGAGGATASFDSSRTIYVAFPNASPHVYISRSQSSGATTPSDTKSLRGLVIEGIPKALSRPRERYTLRATDIQTKNLDAMLAIKGPGRTNAVGGGWSIYATGAGEKGKSKDKSQISPLNVALPTPPLSDVAEEQEEGDEAALSNTSEGKRKRALDPVEAEYEKERKRAKLVAQARFGDAARIDDGKGVERVDILIEDAFPALPNLDAALLEDEEEEHNDDDVNNPATRKPKGGRRSSNIHPSLEPTQDSDAEDDGRGRRKEQDNDRGGGGGGGGGRESSWRPNVRLTFHGTHVFAGVRQLVEAGIVDGERAPGWMTGEEGVTVGAVRRGRIRGFKGSGI